MKIQPNTVEQTSRRNQLGSQILEFLFAFIMLVTIIVLLYMVVLPLLVREFLPALLNAIN